MAMAPIPEDKIAERSYLIWEREGRPEGRHLEHWYRARAELDAEADRKPMSQSEQFLRILRAG